MLFATGTSWRGLSGYEELMIDKENSLALAGRELDCDLISSVSRKSFIALTACVVFNIALMYKLPINNDFYYTVLKFFPYAMGNSNEMLMQLSFNIGGCSCNGYRI